MVDCGPPPSSTDCVISYIETSCGSNAEYSPVNSTIRIFGDTTLTCGSDGTWQVDPSEGFPFCIPRKQSLTQYAFYHTYYAIGNVTILYIVLLSFNKFVHTSPFCVHACTVNLSLFQASPCHLAGYLHTYYTL